MFSRSRGMVWLAVAAVVITVPALAQGQGSPSTASYTAFDTGGSGATFRWYVTDTTATDVTIAERGTVTFSSRHANIPHNVDFTDEVKPECQLSRSDTASTGPMPPPPARMVRDVHVRRAGRLSLRVRPPGPLGDDRHDHRRRDARRHCVSRRRQSRWLRPRRRPTYRSRLCGSPSATTSKAGPSAAP